MPPYFDNIPLLLPSGLSFFPHSVDLSLPPEIWYKLLAYPCCSPAFFARFLAQGDAPLLSMEEVMFKQRPVFCRPLLANGAQGPTAVITLDMCNLHLESATVIDFIACENTM